MGWGDGVCDVGGRVSVMWEGLCGGCDVGGRVSCGGCDMGGRVSCGGS